MAAPDKAYLRDLLNHAHRILIVRGLKTGAFSAIPFVASLVRRNLGAEHNE
jgi:hypothetical protein